jgi:hypothetical protein
MISPLEWFRYTVPREFIFGYILEISGFMFLLSLFLPVTSILLHFIVADIIWVTLFNMLDDGEEDDRT